MKKMILIFLSCMCLICSTLVIPVNVSATCSYGINYNGTGGINININAHPYTTFAGYDYGQWAYTSQGCAWFASARVHALTGKGYTIRSGVNWWNNGASVLGTSRSSSVPKAPSIICYDNHVAILEKIDGAYAVVSDGGNNRISDYGHGYCAIERVLLSEVPNLTPGFIGYVYLPNATSNNVAMTSPKITLDKSEYRIGDTVKVSWAASSSNSNLSHYWLQVADPNGTYLINDRYETNKGSFVANTVGTYTIKTWATPIGSQSGEGSLIETLKIDVLSNIPKPSKPEVSIQYKDTSEPVNILWEACDNANSYTLFLYDENDQEINKVTNITNTSHALNLSAATYKVMIQANTTDSKIYHNSDLLSFTLIDPVEMSSDGWYYAKALPGNVNSNQYEIQYQHTYELIDTQCEDSSYVNTGLDHTESIPVGDQYESYRDLKTSDTVKLLYYYYYHYCGPSTGNDCNHSFVGNYVHFDSINPSKVKVHATHNDYEDSSIKYYHLKYSDGSDAYCNSNSTCDGTYGSHGNRSCYWYKMNVYQNQTTQNYYKFVKTSSYINTLDQNATSYVVRYRLKNNYEDVQSSDWYYKVVYDASNKGLMSALNKKNNLSYFGPNVSISRGMVATVLYRMANNPKVTFTNKFPDVKQGVWYSNAIIWASNHKVVSGNKDGSFAPDKEICRQDLAIMLRNYANLKGIDTSKVANLTTFLDDEKVDSYAKSAVAWCVQAGLMSGAKTDSGSKLNPKNNASRAECAKMFSLLDDLIQAK